MSEFRVVGSGADFRVAGGESVVILAGIQGPQGNSFGFRWRGAWAAGTQYQVDDAVFNAADKKPYICVAVSIGHQPPHADWSVMAEDGAAAVVTHVGEADPHVQYQKESEKGQVNGYANLDGAGTVPDSQIPATITRDTELDAHVTDATAAHAASAVGFTPVGTIAATDTQAAVAEVATDAAAALTAHEAASDPHAGYQKESEKDAASGYAGLTAGTLVADAQLGSGTPDSTKFLRGDRTWSAPPSAGFSSTLNAQANDVSTSGTTETDAHLYTIPAGKLAVDGDRLIITGGGTWTSNSNTKTVKFYVAGVSMTLASNAAGSATLFFWKVELVRKGATSVVAFATTWYSNTITASPVRAAFTPTLSGTVAIKSTIQMATSGSGTEEFFSVIYEPAA
jgi:hypothetical protein